MQDKYNIVLSGKHPSADAHQVVQKIASLFKCRVEQAEHMLSQPSCVVKKDVTADIADKYKRAIEGTGAQCIIQAVHQEAPLDFDVAPVISVPPAPAAPSSSAFSVGHAAPDPSSPVTPVGQVAGVGSPAAATAEATQARAATAPALSRQEAVQIFVGKNHDYFERKWAAAEQKKNRLSWNWAAFVVGFGWMGFRKMYLYSWIFIGVVAAEAVAELAIGLPGAISNGINIGMAIAFGLKSNAWYLQHVNQRVGQILASHTPDQARIELARQGGTNIGAAVGFVVALLVLLGMIGAIAQA